MARKEEPTKAPTPDKLDRAIRDDANKSSGGETKPYPLTEEEATPNTPDSEASFGGRKLQKKESGRRSEPRKKVAHYSINKKKVTGDTISDYNKFVSHPRKR